MQGWNHPRESFMELILQLRWDLTDREKIFKNAIWAEAIFETVPKNVFWEPIRKGFEDIKNYLPEIEDEPYYTPLSDCEVYSEDSVTSPYTPLSEGEEASEYIPLSEDEIESNPEIVEFYD